MAYVGAMSRPFGLHRHDSRDGICPSASIHAINCFGQNISDILLFWFGQCDL